MASAAAADDLKPLKRSSSYAWLPPYMSELRVVLLGNSWSRRSSVGNFILGETKFNTEEEPDCCQSVTSWLKEQKIVLINTPDLLHPDVSQQDLKKHVEICVSLSAPGPHVFLLVLQPEDFTEEHKVKLCRVLQLFSNQSFDHSLVLISTSREESSAYFEKNLQHSPLKDLIKMCRYRHVKKKNLDVSELLTRLGQTSKENNGDHVSNDEDEDAGLYMTPKFESEHTKSVLNLVLCGRRGAGKTSAAEAILGEKELHSVSNSSECVKKQGEVCGCRVSLVELPALYKKPQEEVMEESLRCISLCDPEGAYAFILVLPVGPLTDEDKEELETIQNTFSSRVNDFTMILFTVKSDPTASDVENFVKGNKEIRELCQRCGGRHFVLNIKDKQQIPELLEAVKKMRVEESRCFTKDMFTKAQMEKVWKLKAELQDMKQRTDDEGQKRETILKEKEEEMRRKEEDLKRKHEKDLKKLNRELEQERKVKDMEKDECINKERQERKREREEEERRWKKHLEASEKIVQSEKTQRESAEKKLELNRKEMKRDRDAWEKERKDLWERIHQEDKQRLEEEKTSHRKLQEEYQRKRRKWTYSLFVLLLLLLFLFYYLFLSYAYTHTTDSTNTRERT